MGKELGGKGMDGAGMYPTFIYCDYLGDSREYDRMIHTACVHTVTKPHRENDTYCMCTHSHKASP